MMERHNDEERRGWVLNDEGLYNWWQSEGGSLLAWVKRNREIIDGGIWNVTRGSKPAHYLAYGG